MDLQHYHERKREPKGFIRLKIITNRDINFITAVRADATITDLANRALNVFLELVGEQVTKKQMTIAAVKQGRFFMPRSEIVSNLLSQDEEVEIIIVKAKPKFPKHAIPSENDYDKLEKYLRPFEGLRQLPKKNQQKADSAILLPNRSDVPAEAQQSKKLLRKRERKKKKRTLKEQERRVDLIEQTIGKHSVEKQLTQILNLESKSKSKQDKEVQTKEGVKCHKSSLKLAEQSIGKFKQAYDQSAEMPREQKNLKESKSPMIIPRKVSVENRSERSEKNKTNPTQSPTVTFHNKGSLDSPKVLYLPESKNMSELRHNLEKEKEKLGMKSPLMMPKSSPKIALLDAQTKNNQNDSKKHVQKQGQKQLHVHPSHEKQENLHKKNTLTKNFEHQSKHPMETQADSKTWGTRNRELQMVTSSLQEQQMKTTSARTSEETLKKIEGQSSNTKNKSIEANKLQETLTTSKISTPKPTPINQQKPQPQIIEQESESEEISIDLKNSSRQASLMAEETIKKKPQKHRFYDIDMKINQFKLQDSDEEG